MIKEKLFWGDNAMKNNIISELIAFLFGLILERLRNNKKISTRAYWWFVAGVIIALFIGIFCDVKIVDEEYKKSNGNYYLAIYDKVSWDDARKDCEARYGHLATISTAEENALVSSLIPFDSFWLGALKDGNGEWKWIVDKEDFAYVNWNDNEPSNGVHEQVLVMLKGGAWDDGTQVPNYEDAKEDSDEGMFYVCEWDHWIMFRIGIAGEYKYFGIF